MRRRKITDAEPNSKKERMQQNLTRHKAETRLNDAVIEDFEKGCRRRLSLNNQINIQMAPVTETFNIEACLNTGCL